MSRFERHLLRLAAVRAGLLLLLLFWLALFLNVSRDVGLHGRLFAPGGAAALLSRQLMAMEVALAVAVPLAITAVVLTLKRSGVLTVFLAAGMDPGRLRRPILLAAAAASLASAALIEAVPRGYGAGDPLETPALRRCGDLRLWCLGADRDARRLTDVILFREGDLAVSRAEEGTWVEGEGAILLSEPASLFGEPIGVRRVVPAPPRKSPVAVPAVSDWPATGFSVTAVLATVNRAALPGILVLVAGYLALLLPVSRQRLAYVALLACLPVAGLAVAACGILLWSGGAAGVVAELAWLAAVALAVVALDRGFRVRGLRLA
ncbi:MAG: hypothetical protein ACYTDY_04675 [Planctomycetota bacterium]|jgi:hypothetical protein